MMKKIYNFFLRIETLNRAAFVMMLSVFFVGQVWGESESITWSGSSLVGTGGTHVTAGTATAVDGDTNHAGTLSINSNKITTVKKNHNSNKYWEDFSETSQTATSTNATTTARIEFPITIASSYELNVSSVSFRFDKQNGDGPAIHTFLVQGSTSTWLGYTYSSGSTTTYSGLDIDLTAGDAKLVIVLGLRNNLGNERGFQFSNVVINGTSAIGKKTVYLDPNISDWKQGDERYAVYYFEEADHSNNGWVDMSATGSGDCSGVYKADISLAYDKCVICRMNGSTIENKWTNRLDQTDDLTVADGMYCTITASSGGTATCTFNNKPFEVCVTGTWLAFSGETITLNATCPGATNFQWYKGTDPIAGATSATYTKTNCTIEDGGNYYCKAWNVTGDENATYSSVFGVRVPRLIIQTPGSGSDRQDTAFTRGSTSDEAATCGVYLGVAWKYEFAVYDGIDYYGNTGTMYSTSCTNWTMSGSTWCKIETTKEGTYTFNLTFSNSSYEPLRMSVVYPPMVQTPGINLYIENTPAMQSRGWDNDNIYYRIGKGKYDKGDTRNWTSVLKMELVPGTDRYLKTTTPSWGADFWAWHVANNKGDADTESAIYRTKSDGGFAITESSNFSGDEITSDRTIYLNSTSGGYGKDAMNNNCQFYGYTSTPGMLTHKVTVKKTTHGTILVEWTDVNGNPQEDEGYSERDINNLAHTCILTITGVPESCRYKLKSLKVNSSSFTSGNTFILTADAEITAEFEEQSYNVTLHTNGGTINSGDVTKYTHEKGAILPTDVTKGTESFGGWYGNSSLTGMPVTEISADECGNKEFWAKWGSPCEFQPIITKVSPTFTIWDGKLVDAAIANLSCNFDTTGIKYSLKSATPV